MRLADRACTDTIFENHVHTFTNKNKTRALPFLSHATHYPLYIPEAVVCATQSWLIQEYVYGSEMVINVRIDCFDKCVSFKMNAVKVLLVDIFFS
jgi:hypothetical protein